MAISTNPFSSTCASYSLFSFPSKKHTIIHDSPVVAQTPSEIDALAEKITTLVSRYLYLRSPDDQFYAVGRASLLKTVHRYITQNEQMELVFPGFPFKSPSDKKVLGRLPDLGEEFLLRRLEDLARTIESCYAPGAVVRIVSDGVVYGEILGQSDHSVYRYNETLRQMTLDYGLNHITFVRVVDLLDPTCGLSFHVMSEEEYVTSIPVVREQFLAHEVPGYDLEKDMAESPGTIRTYRGYLKFLESDLEGSDVMTKNKDGKPLSKNGQDKARRVIAKQMLRNGAKFSDLAALKFPHCIRLSVHPHSNAGPKFAFDMFPSLSMAASPWHNVVMEKADGALTMGNTKSFDPSTYSVVYRNGYPYHLREHSPETNLGVEEGALSLEPNLPYGLIIRATGTAPVKLADLSMEKIRALVFRYSVVVMKGIQMPAEKARFEAKVAELSGKEIEEGGFVTSKTTQRQSAMRYDGGASSSSGAAPTLQVIQCLKASSSQSSKSKILLTNTAKLVERGLDAEQLQWLERRYQITSEPDEECSQSRLIGMNSNTGREVLRYQEAPLSATPSSISSATLEESAHVEAALTDLLYDRRFCYAHTFCEGDMVVFDSHEVMHSWAAVGGNSYPDEEMRYARVY